jgi:hypothetical protein
MCIYGVEIEKKVYIIITYYQKKYFECNVYYKNIQIR